MQLVNLTLRLGGSLLHTVPKVNATPAEILILRKLHGEDACVDIRPTKFDANIRQDADWQRLSDAYDRASGMQSAPGEEHKSVMGILFPGAMKKLPTTLEEIGLGHLLSSASIEAADRGEGAAALVDIHGDADITPADIAAPATGLDFTPLNGIQPPEEEDDRDGGHGDDR